MRQLTNPQTKVAFPERTELFVESLRISWQHRQTLAFCKSVKSSIELICKLSIVELWNGNLHREELF
jgi:hypothetical protein